MKTIKISLGLKNYTVSFAPLRSKLKQTLNDKENHLFLTLHQRASQDPSSVLKPLESLYKKHPHSPEIANLLTYVYLKKKETKQAEALICDNYDKNPTDLFAKVNFADQCLRQKKYTRIPDIFEGHFDLHRLYPNKTVFHSSEMSGFATLMSFYHLHLGKKEEALDYYKAAVQADPHAPSLSPLEHALFHSSYFKKLLSSLHPIAKWSNLFLFP